MKIGNVEGTPEELKNIIAYSNLNIEEYFPKKSKYTWIIVMIVTIFIIYILKYN